MSRRVLVLGGNGFIGRHVVDALVAQGLAVAIGTGSPGRSGQHLSAAARRCPQIGIRLEALCRADAWNRLLAGYDAVVNCVGILRQRTGESYADVHCRGPVALAAACKEHSIRLVHVSALGLSHPVTSGFLLSKREGEKRIMRTGGDWHIVRPSLVDGENGFGARWLRRVANWPIQVVPTSSRGKIAPLDAGDLGEAIARIALDRGLPLGMKMNARIYELGGCDQWPIATFLRAMRTRDYDALQFGAPGAVARTVSHLCDLIHVTPLSFGHYELLKYDNVPRINRLEELLGRAPKRLGRAAILSTASPALS